MQKGKLFKWEILYFRDEVLVRKYHNIDAKTCDIPHVSTYSFVKYNGGLFIFEKEEL